MTPPARRGASPRRPIAGSRSGQAPASAAAPGVAGAAPPLGVPGPPLGVPGAPLGVPGADEVLRRLASGGAQVARRTVREVARHTPILSSTSLSERCGGRVVLKAENLQRTGSFKIRGAINKLSTLQGATLVVAGSAGNHGQSLAYAARARGLDCEVFMPIEAPVAKVAAVEAFGGVVHLQGESVDECVAAARARSAQAGAVFVHPFDDVDVILGQATLGLELLEDVEQLAQVVIPVGGGGLIAGVAGVVKQASPATRVVGVQVDACAPYPQALREGAPATFQARPTIADGIAIKRPGEITLALVRRLVDEIVVVSEEEIADAMVWLLERSKLVVEGGGAAGVAALLAGRVAPAAHGSTVVVLSGGNVDPGLLAAVAHRHETLMGRRLRLFTRISDRPGGLAALLTQIARAGGNVVQADHVREAVQLHVRETGIEIALETRGREHGERIVAALQAAGYEVRRLDP
ncbi:MAG TPA: threonine ammonia-lyase [Solirubrobacteraceae bacterium]|nr:threonine ammonia-lyase [Solirubrobacteraceae bacterium]